jgi:hypothetical protein
MSLPEAGTSPPAHYVVGRGGLKPMVSAGTVFSGSAGADKTDAGRGLPHNKVRFATVEGIVSRKGSVKWMPERSRSGILNHRHVDVVEGESGAFGEPEQNPSPEDERIR